MAAEDDEFVVLQPSVLPNAWLFNLAVFGVKWKDLVYFKQAK